MLLTNDEKFEVKDVVIAHGAHFKKVADDLYKVGLMKLGEGLKFEWGRFGVRLCDWPSSVVSAVEQGEPILTSKKTKDKVLKIIQKGKAASPRLSPRAPPKAPRKELPRSKDPETTSLSNCEVIDLYLAKKDELMDIPGVDEDTAEEIIKARKFAWTFSVFLDKGGFRILTEEIQYEVGLLARRELVLAFNQKRLDQQMLEDLERKMFGSIVAEWNKRKHKGREEVLISVLSVLNGTLETGKKHLKLIKNVLKNDARPWIEWKMWAATVLSLLPEPNTYSTALKSKVVAKNTKEVVNTMTASEATPSCKSQAMPQIVWNNPTKFFHDRDIVDLSSRSSDIQMKSDKRKETMQPASDEMLARVAEETGEGSMFNNDNNDNQTMQGPGVVTSQTETDKPVSDHPISNEIVLEEINSEDSFSSDNETGTDVQVKTLPSASDVSPDEEHQRRALVRDNSIFSPINSPEKDTDVQYDQGNTEGQEEADTEQFIAQFPSASDEVQPIPSLSIGSFGLEKDNTAPKILSALKPVPVEELLSRLSSITEDELASQSSLSLSSLSEEQQTTPGTPLPAGGEAAAVSGVQATVKSSRLQAREQHANWCKCELCEERANWCKVCNVKVYGGLKNMWIHESGKKHIAKVRRKGNYDKVEEVGRKEQVKRKKEGSQAKGAKRNKVETFKEKEVRREEEQCKDQEVKSKENECKAKKVQEVKRKDEEMKAKEVRRNKEENSKVKEVRREEEQCKDQEVNSKENERKTKELQELKRKEEEKKSKEVRRNKEENIKVKEVRKEEEQSKDQEVRRKEDENKANAVERKGEECKTMEVKRKDEKDKANENKKLRSESSIGRGEGIHQTTTKSQETAAEMCDPEEWIRSKEALDRDKIEKETANKDSDFSTVKTKVYEPAVTPQEGTSLMHPPSATQEERLGSTAQDNVGHDMEHSRTLDVALSKDAGNLSMKKKWLEAVQTMSLTPRKKPNIEKTWSSKTIQNEPTCDSFHSEEDSFPMSPTVDPKRKVESLREAVKSNTYEVVNIDGKMKIKKRKKKRIVLTKEKKKNVSSSDDEEDCFVQPKKKKRRVHKRLILCEDTETSERTPIPKLVIVKQPTEDQPRAPANIWSVASATDMVACLEPSLELKPLSDAKIERMTKRTVQDCYEFYGYEPNEPNDTGCTNETRANPEALSKLESAPTPNRKTFKCNMCQDNFYSYEERHDHYIQNHSLKRKLQEKNKPSVNIKSLACTLCGALFDDFKNRHQHFLEEHCGVNSKSCKEEKKSFKCFYCDNNFSNTEDRHRHYMQEHKYNKHSKEAGMDQNQNVDQINKITQVVNVFDIYVIFYHLFCRLMLIPLYRLNQMLLRTETKRKLLQLAS